MCVRACVCVLVHNLCVRMYVCVRVLCLENFFLPLGNMRLTFGPDRIYILKNPAKQPYAV
jgi:hypothetical protein